jgi:hypothetical protein
MTAPIPAAAPAPPHLSNSASRFQAEVLRLTTSAIDIKLRVDDRMHVLQWRRRMFADFVLVDGRRQHVSRGLWGREKVFGLVFGGDPTHPDTGERMIFTVDPTDSDWSGMSDRAAGVRLDTVEGPLVALGSLDPKELERPETFTDLVKKSLGMQWGGGR